MNIPCTFEGILHNLCYKPPVGVSRWPPADVRDITSVVHLSVIKCFGLVISDKGIVLPKI